MSKLRDLLAHPEVEIVLIQTVINDELGTIEPNERDTTMERAHVMPGFIALADPRKHRHVGVGEGFCYLGCPCGAELVSGKLDGPWGFPAPVNSVVRILIPPSANVISVVVNDVPCIVVPASWVGHVTLPKEEPNRDEA